MRDFIASLREDQFPHSLRQSVADAREPNRAAQVMIGMIASGQVPLVPVLFPGGIEIFRRPVHEHIRPDGFDVAFERRHIVHCELGLLNGEHGAFGRLGPVLAHGGDDKRQPGRMQVPPNVRNEVFQVGFVFLLRAVLVVPALEPDKAGQFQRPTAQRGEQRACIGEHLPDFRQHGAIRRAVGFPDVVQRGQWVVHPGLRVVFGDAFLGLLEFLFQNPGGGPSSRRRAELFEQGVPAPGGLDENHRFLEAVALPEVREEVFGLRVGGLMIEERVGRLPFHVRLPGEDENPGRIIRGGGVQADTAEQQQVEDDGNVSEDGLEVELKTTLAIRASGQ